MVSTRPTGLERYSVIIAIRDPRSRLVPHYICTSVEGTRGYVCLTLVGRDNADAYLARQREEGHDDFRLFSQSEKSS